MDRRVKPGDDDLQFLDLSPHHSTSLLSLNSLSTSFSHFAAPSRGACGAPVALGCMRRTPIGPPYTLTQDARERACDRRADASSNDRPEQMPALRSLRTTGSPWPRSIYATRASQPGLRRDVLRYPATGTLAFTALHVGFLARARARRYPSIRLR